MEFKRVPRRTIASVLSLVALFGCQTPQPTQPAQLPVTTVAADGLIPYELAPPEVKARLDDVKKEFAPMLARRRLMATSDPTCANISSDGSGSTLTVIQTNADGSYVALYTSSTSTGTYYAYRLYTSTGTYYIQGDGFCSPTTAPSAGTGDGTGTGGGTGSTGGTPSSDPSGQPSPLTSPSVEPTQSPQPTAVPTPTTAPSVHDKVTLELDVSQFFNKVEHFNDSPSGADSDVVVYVGVNGESAAWTLEVENYGVLMRGNGPDFFMWDGSFDGSALPPGTYNLKLSCNGASDSKTMTILSPRVAMAALPVIAPRLAVQAARFSTVISIYGARLLPFFNRSSTVWSRITATQPPYANTWIPRSFTITVENGRTFWVHGNATEHMEEYLRGFTTTYGYGLGSQISMVNTQALLTSFSAAVSRATAMGIQFGTRIRIDNWEFIFERARPGQTFPVIKHAMYWH